MKYQPNPAFVQGMSAQLKQNKHKGVWEDWKPTPEVIAHHIAKHARALTIAVEKKRPRLVRKHSIAVANFASKAHELYAGNLPSSQASP